MDLPSGCDTKSGSWSMIILAGRYRISKKVGAGIFKAQDLALDQTVTVRGPFRSAEGYGEPWRKKARQLAAVRNPHFLNVLALISEESGDFLVSEHPRGKSVGELLTERQCFDVEDVLTLMISLTSALDLAALFTCSPRLISARYLFAESKHWVAVSPGKPSFAELGRLWVRLDASELATPMRNNGSPWLISEPPRRGFKRWAVRQAALLTYELLGGDPEDGIEVKRRFRPIISLSKSSNDVLYHGLLGSSRYRTSESFIRKVEEARESSKAKMWSVRAFQTKEDSTLNVDTNDVLRRFNRETRRLVSAVLSLIIFCALAFTVLVPEHQLKMGDLKQEQEASQSNPVSLSSLAFPMLSRGEEMSRERRMNVHVPTQEPRIDRDAPEFTPAETPERLESVAGQTAHPVLVMNSQINQLREQPNGNKLSPEPRDVASAIRILVLPKRHKPPDRLKVKMRLLVLWHQSLARNRSHGWMLLSSKGGNKNVSYTVHASH